MSVMSVLGLESPSYPGRVMAVCHRTPWGQTEIPVPPREKRWSGADPSVPTPEADTDPRTSHPGSRHRPAPPTPPLRSGTAPCPTPGPGPGPGSDTPRTDPIRSVPHSRVETARPCRRGAGRRPAGRRGG